MRKVELLAPLKNKKSLNAVIGKADSVYFGIESLNMRMFADNIRLDELSEIVRTCHDDNIQAYLTTNVIVYDNEFELLEQILDEASKADIDGIIIHDVGAIRLAKEKGLKIHISTQANISNIHTARFYEDMGAERLILARELSLEQIKNIKQQLSKVKIETFVHGAQCTSISGRCYFSAEVCASQDYSANRGRCVQPCRRRWRVIDDQNNELLYDGVFFINAKDLCMIEHVPKLMDAKIDAFKIEGRMRGASYIDEVVSCYREAIDAHYEGTFTQDKVQQWLNRLRKVYNRGFSTGFYFGMPKGSEIERERSGNISEYRKQEIGRVLSYYRNKKSAKILLTRGKLRLKDEVYIIGGPKGTYFKQEIGSIQIKQKKNLAETPLASTENPITVGILVDRPLKKNDKLYKIEKRVE